MKCTGIILFSFLFPVILFAQAGSSCGNPIALTLDGVTRTYSTMTTASPTLCSNPGNGSPTTFFSITTNGSAECILLSIQAPTAQPCEVTFYNATTCSGGTYESVSSMCFDDGSGLWAPAETFVLSPNTTYIVRVIVTAAGTISIAAQHNTPENNDCIGATTLSPTYITDNNACHKPSIEVLPSQLCAFTLENTAFYKYTVASTGTSTINITNINCDNGNANNSNGFQIGFFTGTCASLTPVSCSSGSGSTVNATTSSLPAGTNVYVGVDGIAGSNCSYQIRATNSLALAAYIKYFSAWKTSSSNILKWLTLQEFNNKHFEIERSIDGINFSVIARIDGEIESYFEKQYQYEDRQPPVKSYYRLKEIDIDGNAKYFRTIVVIRTDLPYIHLTLDNPLTDNLLMGMQTNVRGEMNMKIISLNGIMFKNEIIKVNKGENKIYKNISSLPLGMYHLIIIGDNVKATKSFIKTNHRSFK